MLTQQSLGFIEQTNTQTKALLTQRLMDKKNLEDLFAVLTTQQSQDMKEQMKAYALSLEVIQTISAHCSREAKYQNQVRHLLSEIRKEVINQSLSK